MSDATGHAFHSGRPASSSAKYMGSVKIEDAESHQTELCDIWAEGDLSSVEGFSICLLSERSVTNYNVKSGLGVDNSYTVSYTILDGNHFSGNMFEEIDTLRHLLIQLRILI